MVKIIKPSVEILTDIDGDKILKHIEKCGRTCYQSYQNETEDTTSAKNMIQMLIKMGHESVLEHFLITIKAKIDVGCYDDKTYVLTEHGWKLFKDLNCSEKVYTTDDEGNVILVNYLSKIEKDWDGMMYNYHSTQVNLNVTPDHNMWVFDEHKRSKQTKIWKFLSADEMNNSAYKFDKRGNKTENNSNRYINIPSVVRQQGFYKKEYKGHQFNNEDFFELLGWWITDGSIEKTTSSHFQVTLFQTKSQGRKRIEELLNNLKLEYTCYKNRYRIKSPALADYIMNEFYSEKNDESGYKKSYDIKISDFIRNGYTNEIKAFINGCIGGDGTIYKDGRKIIYTASKQFALDLIELCFKCGITANYYMQPDLSKYDSSPYKQNTPIYVVSICRTEITWFDKNDKNFSIEPYKGKVYCVELEKYHRLFVMRDGKTCWCGNCYKDLTRHRHASFSIESTRFCNYSKGKFGNELTVIEPCNMDKDSGIYHTWLKTMNDIEKAYMDMSELGAKPDQLRMILPHSLAAEVTMSANLREWRHIFKMRCQKAAHPSVRQIMLKTLNEFHNRIPVVFDDLYEEFKEDIENNH